MKALIRKSKGVVLGFAAASATLLPLNANAANSLIQKTGISDNTLFFVLTAIAIFQIILIYVISGAIKAIASNPAGWKSKWKKTASAVLIGAFVLSGNELFAQDSRFDELIVMDDIGFIVMLLINVVLFATFVFLVLKLKGLIKMMRNDDSTKVSKSFIDTISAMLTKSVPIDQEAAVEMDHEYDGIRELDNSLPPWWLWGFYASILFAFVYVFYYHISGYGQLQDEEYAIEMKDADAAKAVFEAANSSTVDESNVELLTDEADLAAGEKIFKLYCAPCHSETGGSMPGGVGPNLTDDFWINGGSISDIFKTIKYGVPSKGMVSWEAQLSDEKIQQLSSYIKFLRGTNPENAKEPQGDLYTEDQAETTPTSDAAAEASSSDNAPVNTEE